MPDYKELRDKENVADNLSHLSGASSEPSLLLIRFYEIDTAKVYPGGGSGRSALGSTYTLCLSPVKRTPLQKK